MMNSIDEYIRESRSWFFKTHLSPIIDTTRFIFLLIFIIIALDIIWSIISMNNETLIMRFPIYVENKKDANHFIKNLFEPDKSMDEVFAVYMIKKYVTLRESYSPNILDEEIWENKLVNISSISSNKVFNEFLNQMLPNKNIDSPIIKYRFGSSVVPIIESVQFNRFSGKKPITATVNLKSLECSYKYNTCIAKNFNIDINFEINAYPRFRFRIQDYRKSPATNTTS